MFSIPDLEANAQAASDWSGVSFLQYMFYHFFFIA